MFAKLFGSIKPRVHLRTKVMCCVVMFSQLSGCGAGETSQQEMQQQADHSKLKESVQQVVTCSSDSNERSAEVSKELASVDVSNPKVQSLKNPATIEDAAELIDLRDFPRVKFRELAEAGKEYVGQVRYLADCDVKTAREFYQNELQQRGWEPVPIAKELITDQFTRLQFRRNEFTLEADLSVDPIHSATLVSITNHGNIDVSRVRKLDDADVRNESSNWSFYVSDYSLAEISDFYQSNLADAGWRRVRGFHKSESVDDTVDLKFVRNGIIMSALIQSNPRYAPGKRVVSCRTILRKYDFPITSDATSVKLDDAIGRIEFETSQSAQEVIEFYAATILKPGGKWVTFNQADLGNRQRYFLFGASLFELTIEDFAKTVVRIQPVYDPSLQQRAIESLIDEASVPAEAQSKRNREMQPQKATISEAATFIEPFGRPTLESSVEESVRAKDGSIANAPSHRISESGEMSIERENSGLLRIGKNEDEFKHFIAYKTTVFEDDPNLDTVVMATEQAIPAKSMTALLESLKENGDEDAFSLFRPNVRLTFHSDGELMMFHAWAGNVSPNGNSGFDAEFVDNEGRVSGHAVMKKPREFCNVTYQKNLTFDLELLDAAAKLEMRAEPSPTTNTNLLLAKSDGKSGDDERIPVDQI